MKVKDIVLAGLITINLALLVLVAAVTFFGHETPATASTTGDAGYFRACTAKISETREALVIIDTVTNRMNFYINEPGQAEFKPYGTTIDLSRAFQHSTP